MKTILVTGANGFIGRSLVQMLTVKYAVYGVGRRNAETVSAIWDFRDPLPIEIFPAKVDVIIHAGGIVGLHPEYTEQDYFAVNVESCCKLCQYAIAVGAKQVIYFSTGGVYGNGAAPWREDATPCPTEMYSRSKLQGELEVSRLAKSMKVAIIRLFFPYGYGQGDKRFIPRLIQTIRGGQAVRLHNEQGSPRINPIFIDDVVKAISELIDQAFSGIINLAGPDTVTIRELAQMIGRSLHQPVTFDIQNTPAQNFLGDVTKLYTLIPHFRMTGLSQGIIGVIDSLDRQKNEHN